MKRKQVLSSVTADVLPTGVGVGTSGTIYFSSDIENAIYKVRKK